MNHLGNKNDASNTLVLDNEAEKFRNHPENGIVVPEFGLDEVRSRKRHTLMGLQKYLLYLGKATAEDSKFDVRMYTKKLPFGVDQVDEIDELSNAVNSLSVKAKCVEDLPEDTKVHLVCVWMDSRW